MAKLTQKQEIQLVVEQITDLGYLNALYNDLLDLVRVYDRMKNAYMYKPQQNRGAKDYYDNRNSVYKEFEFGGYIFKVDLDTVSRSKYVKFEVTVNSNSPWSDNMGTINKIFEVVKQQRILKSE